MCATKLAGLAPILTNQGLSANLPITCMHACNVIEHNLTVFGAYHAGIFKVHTVGGILVKSAVSDAGLRSSTADVIQMNGSSSWTKPCISNGTGIWNSDVKSVSVLCSS